MASTVTSPEKNFLRCSVKDLFSLEGKNIIITGGARGLGLVFAFAVAEVGANVAVLDASAKVDEDFLLLKERYPSQHFKSYQVDVTQYDAVQNIVDAVVQNFGRIDGLITAAGVCTDQPFLESSPSIVARTFNVNVLGTYYVTQVVAKQMRRQDEAFGEKPQGGSIIFIASLAAHAASAGQHLSDYGASKGAVITLCKLLGVELAPYGIRVNSVSPGYAATDMTTALWESQPHLRHVMLKLPPMERLANLTDLKGIIVYLLSEASAYQTAEDVRITGGLHAGRSDTLLNLASLGDASLEK